MADQLFDDDALAGIYDHFNPWAPSDDFYLRKARESGGPVLDLGCGTGMLACRMAAEGLTVTGVDPAEAMLRIARSRPGGDMVEWIESDGQSLDVPRRFGLALMNGHAFQTLLGDEAALALLRNVARHLAPNGRFIIETRNPLVRAWLDWVPESGSTTVDVPGAGRVEESHDASADRLSGIVSLTHRYRFIDRGIERVARNRIRFIAKEHLAKLITETGLSALAWFGGWDEAPWSPSSEEIVAVTAAQR